MIEQVIGIAANGEADGDLARFARVLFSAAGADDLGGFSPEALAGQVADAFEFTRDMPETGGKVRVRNVSLEQEGDQPAKQFTLVEILNRDMPFLVDSVMAEIQSRDLEIALVTHPILVSTRDGEGRLLALSPVDGAPEGGTRESYIRIHLAPISDAECAPLEAELDAILASVRVVVADWKPMLQRLDEAIGAYTSRPPDVHDPDEAIGFLRWLNEGHFTFLGMRDYDFEGDVETGTLTPRFEGGLGLLRDPDVRVLRRGRELVHMTPEVRRFLLQPQALIVTKANVVAKVHRRAHMDYVGVKSYGSDGRLTGELRIVGLFTSGAYTRAPRNVPLLRRKVEHVLQSFGHPPDSHDGKALVNVIETFPRDELFQISMSDLRTWAAGILELELRPRTRVFPRIDEFDRFVSVLVFVPRDRYTTASRQQIGHYLATVYNGTVSAFFPSFSAGPLVRVQFIIGRYEGVTPKIDAAELDRAVSAIVRSWEDKLGDAIGARFSGESRRNLVARYRQAFSASYRDSFTPDRALEDIGRIERLSSQTPVAIDFHRDEDAPDFSVRVAIYSLETSLPLSRRVPIFENLGFSVIDERSFKLKPVFDGLQRTVRLHDMVLETSARDGLDMAEHEQRLEACFLAVCAGRAVDDHFNRLVRAVGITWREATLVRAFASYMRQIRVPFGPRYISDTLLHHSAIAGDLLELFRVRFDPGAGLDAAGREAREAEIVSGIEQALTEVQSLDEDRILRQFTNLVRATRRTNFYLRGDDDEGAETITFKLDSKHVENAPEPRPFAEIFVFSPRVEGVHLRGGPIARGGLRWSDRAQDFRTEVLGLAKAQQVKNAVIVPAGAKGGFVPKQLPRDGTREEFIAEGVASYQQFVSSLIELTDNIEGDAVVPPAGIIRLDGDDPYLVVAADKGTAAFSDYANEISVGKNFWLGDAFASGGSAGYDHKKIAITARGGWEAVKRHFREMGIDIQKTPFTVIGIGDMSGDVFGNGMLLSHQIRLQVAFDHRDIFIDPVPDTEASWNERKRMFGIGRSSWQDYDTGLISQGGGVFSRSLKSIELSDEMRALSGLDVDHVTPAELIRAFLSAPFDLLWFGGIGTYVKASGESDEAVGDRANDALRVTAADLRVKVIGEGANLGLTQRGRIEFAQRGGRLNTDAIDNSAGVNSSDLEVNIKIALRSAVTSGSITMEERNTVLAGMTDDVAASCLRNNYLQTLALSLGERRGIGDLGFQQRLMRSLEAQGHLDRPLEDLPSDSEIEERTRTAQPLTRPELAVLLSYAKIALFETLIESSVPDDPYLESVLFGYFPPGMRERFADGIKGHRLRREIIATVLTNDVINRGGSTMVVRLAEESGHSEADILYAFAAVRETFGLRDLWRRIDALDGLVGGAIQLDLYIEVQQLLRGQTSWFLRHCDFSAGLGSVIEQFDGGIRAYIDALDGAQTERQRTFVIARSQKYVKAGVPEDLALEIARLEFASDAPNAVLVAQQTGRAIGDVVQPFSQLDDFFRIGELRAAAESMAVTDYFDRLAINSTLGILADAHRQLAVDVLDGPGNFAAWQEAGAKTIARTKSNLGEILDGGELTLARLAVAASQARDLISS